MIDVSKCEFEESTGNDLEDHTVYYFSYPMECAADLGMTDVITELRQSECVISICISLSIWDDGSIDMAVSPTVDRGDYLYDCEWGDYYNWDKHTVLSLLNLTH